MSILDERELTDDERVAIADEPRPGVWIERDPDGDGRALSQIQTDALIVSELYRHASAVGLYPIVGPRVRCDLPPRVITEAAVTALEQRGGIHSDPLVRLLAFRAWGDRDRRWRKRDTAKALGAHEMNPIDAYRRAYGMTGLAVYSQPWKRCTLFDAARGDGTAVAELPDRVVDETDGVERQSDGTFLVFGAAFAERLLDVFDELDVKLSATE